MYCNHQQWMNIIANSIFKCSWLQLQSVYKETCLRYIHMYFHLSLDSLDWRAMTKVILEKGIQLLIHRWKKNTKAPQDWKPKNRVAPSAVRICKWNDVSLALPKHFLLLSQDISSACGRNSGSQFVFGAFDLVTSWLSIRCSSCPGSVWSPTGWRFICMYKVDSFNRRNW